MTLEAAVTSGLAVVPGAAMTLGLAVILPTVVVLKVTPQEDQNANEEDKKCLLGKGGNV